MESVYPLCDIAIVPRLHPFFQAWLVVVASFLTNGIIFGTINSFGVIFVYLKEQYAGENAAATKASLVGSVAVGATFFLSPLSGILCDKFGLRKTAIVGGILAFVGMLLSSFFVDRVRVRKASSSILKFRYISPLSHFFFGRARPLGAARKIGISSCPFPSFLFRALFYKAKQHKMS